MQSWKNLLGYQHKEFINEPLQVLSGAVPANLKGVLYRNTAAILPRKNGLAGHLFDGDGAILKVQFDGSQVVYGSYKFVQTEGFVKENQENELIYPGLGRTATGNRLTKIWNASKSKNAANTSLLPLQQGPLLALWEGGWPHMLEKSSLKTLGLTNGNMLKEGEAFSAHPKSCPKSNLIYNFGMVHGKNSYVHVVEMDQTGKILKMNSVQAHGPRFMIHDFIMAGQYLIVPIYPNFMNSIFDYLTAAKGVGEDISFRPEDGIQIVIFDRNDNLRLVSNTINKDSFWVWHYSNGYVSEDGNIVIEYPAYSNMDSYVGFFIENLKKGLNLKSWYERIIINPKDAKIIDRIKLFDDIVEFPVVADEDVGLQWDTTYANITLDSNDFFNGVVKYHKQTRITRMYEQGQYVSEALYVQDKTQEKGKGWLLLTYYDGNVNKNFVDILNSDNLETICRLELPSVIAISFHGKFEQL